MKDMLKLFKLLSDESRLRILMLLTERELCKKKTTIKGG
jgi:DNA-binding transcriptional ArsR family regulator